MVIMAESLVAEVSYGRMEVRWSGSYWEWQQPNLIGGHKGKLGGIDKTLNKKV